MTDEPKSKENKEEKGAAAPEQAKPEQKAPAAPEVKAEAPKQEAKAPEASPAEAKKEEKKEEKKEAAPAVVVKRGKGSRPKQCSECKKNLKKKTWYYRSNQYYCNKNCWKTSNSKAPKAPAAA